MSVCDDLHAQEVIWDNQLASDTSNYNLSSAAASADLALVLLDDGANLPSPPGYSDLQARAAWLMTNNPSSPLIAEYNTYFTAHGQVVSYAYAITYDNYRINQIDQELVHNGCG
jgi:hypothetical protein